MKLSRPQQDIANSTARFKVVAAGRRFGKTYLSMREIAYRARFPNREVFYITTSYRAAKMIMWKPLKRRLIDLRWVDKINESELSILLKNGSTISLKGSEDPDKLRGVSLDYAVIDEAADCKLNSLWGEIIRPALADRQGGALFIGTPKGKSNPFYDLYTFANDSGNINWRAWQYTTLEGGFVTAEEIEAAKADMSLRQFRQEFLATFETYENRVAWNFNRDIHVVEPQNIDTRTLVIGMDFNVNPTVSAIAVQTPTGLHQFDEIRISSSNTEEMAQEITRRYPKSRITVFPDPSGNQRRTSANGQTDHTILQNWGFTVKAPHRHDPVRDRINAANSLLMNAQGQSRFTISKTCKYTIECLEKHTFKEGTGIPDKDTGYDHMFDALTYMIAYLYPLRKTVDTSNQPQKWGVALY